jgi:hypothetical protein
MFERKNQLGGAEQFMSSNRFTVSEALRIEPALATNYLCFPLP